MAAAAQQFARQQRVDRIVFGQQDLESAVHGNSIGRKNGLGAWRQRGFGLLRIRAMPFLCAAISSRLTSEVWRTGLTR